MSTSASSSSCHNDTMSTSRFLLLLLILCCVTMSRAFYIVANDSKTMQTEGGVEEMSDYNDETRQQESLEAIAQLNDMCASFKKRDSPSPISFGRRSPPSQPIGADVNMLANLLCNRAFEDLQGIDMY